MKTAIVTGASGNLGTAVIRRLIQEGYFVTGTVSSGASLVNFPKDRFERVVVNLNDEAAAEKVISDMVERHGKIDLAVLTVGGFRMGSFATTSGKEMMQQYQLNFETTYHMARPVFNHMMEQRQGRIFMIGSRPGIDARSARGMVAYGLSKSLIFRLAELMNDEARGSHVITTAIVPSTLDTPSNRSSMPQADFGTWVKPESIAETIIWYCSPEASPIREPVVKLYGDA